jgi:predicted dehydrogenase
VVIALIILQATGKISGWFVEDILRSDWPDKSANHIVQAIGSSSLQKCQKFADEFVTSKQQQKPSLYGSYQEVYDDKDVDCVYIGTPHSFHKQNCLDAIKARKNVLCEKPFTMNTKEAEEVFTAAKAKNVFIMEAMWTRFFPVVKAIQKFLHGDKKLGKIFRMWADFGLDIDIPSLPADSRYKDPALGAGSLLDIGIYSLTWGLVALSDRIGDDAEDPEVSSTQSINHGVDTDSSVLLHYPSNGRQGVCTSSTNFDSTGDFARVEGSKGCLTVYGYKAASPQKFTFYPKDGSKEEVHEFEKPGRGFYWEADAVAHDLKAGRKESNIMPWSETLRMMRIMDGVRKRGGARFPVDDW